jgi:hypothetical protein
MSSAWGTAGGAVGGGTADDRSHLVETFTLSAGDITNKYIILSSAPPVSQVSQTILTIIGGPVQEYGACYSITTDDGGKRLSWDGLALDGFLVAGDKLHVQYPVVVPN